MFIDPIHFANRTTPTGVEFRFDSLVSLEIRCRWHPSEKGFHSFS